MNYDFGVYCVGSGCGVRLKKKKGRGAPKRRCPACEKKHADAKRRKPLEPVPCARCGCDTPQKAGRGRGKIFCSANCKWAEFADARRQRNKSEMSTDG